MKRTNTTAPSDDVLLNSRQVAEMLNVSIFYVDNHTRDQQEPVIPCFKIGKNSRRFRRADVRAFIARLAKQKAA
jgi:hypothetical protein